MVKVIDTVVFDLGGVLIDWNPRYLYRRLMNGDEMAMERFLSEVCTQEWNEEQDAGRDFVEAETALKARYPDKAELIEAWNKHFNDMMKGPVEGALSILSELRARGVPLYALTNWSAETFPIAQKRFSFLQWFRGIVVSGQEKVIKPDARIYRILIDRYAIDPSTAVYIDDNTANVEAAHDIGFTAIHFTDPAKLRQKLEKLELLETSMEVA